MSSAKNVSASQDSRLDDLALETLRLMQEIINYKLQLQDLIKSGTVNLAKSRYIMGNRSISTMQLPTEDSAPFTALCKVEHNSQDVGDVKAMVFSLKREEPVKRRALNAKEENTESSCAGDANDSRLSSDPLQWFGVLVPQKLRSAQESFKKAIDISVHIASLQAQLEAHRIEFCTTKLDQLQL